MICVRNKIIVRTEFIWDQSRHQILMHSTERIYIFRLICQFLYKFNTELHNLTKLSTTKAIHTAPISKTLVITHGLYRISSNTVC